jgi:hypothetical protein
MSYFKSNNDYNYDFNRSINSYNGTIINPIFASSVNFPYHDVKPICFLKSTPTLTPTGYKMIELLQVGGVCTGDSRIVKIVEINRTRHMSLVITNPFIIPKVIMNATEPVYVSPNHGIIFNGFQ